MTGNKAEERSNDPKCVFVVHGRNAVARDEVFKFLKALGLEPLEWSEAIKRTGAGSPYIGKVLDTAFETAQAVLVLMTPDEIACLDKAYAEVDRDPECEPSPQPRPNVLFEAGMAIGRREERTIIVEFGSIRPFSDIAGRHVIRLDGSIASRKEIKSRLETARCDVFVEDDSWQKVGNLNPPQAPGNESLLESNLPKQESIVKIEARYERSDNGGSYLYVSNKNPFPIYNVDIEIPDEARPGFNIHGGDLPLPELPAYKTFSCIAIRTLGGGSRNFKIKISAETEDGQPIQEEEFISLM